MADEDGWRWMILVESFFTLFFNTGISFTNGVLFVALKETFDDGDKLEWITWIGSVYLSMTALGGPLCSFIINVFDSRVCILLSGIFGLVGFVTSSLVSDIKLLFLTYSLMSGFSVCLSSCGALVILCYYFKDRAGIATAFSLTGVGMGAFIYPRLTRELIDK